VWEKAGNALAIEPVVIRTLEKCGNDVQISATTLMGVPVRFHISKTATDLVPLPADNGRAYLLPSFMKFAKMSNLVTNSSLVADPEILTKMATVDALGPNSCRVTSPVDGRLYLFQGPIADTMKCSGIEQYPDEAIFKLACMGLSTDQALQVLDRARNEGKVVVGGLKSLNKTASDLGSDKRAVYMQMLASLPALKKDTVKLAADIKDPASVDRILSLNFLNPQNIGVLVDHMKDLEDTGTRLSEMLIATRMGAKEDLNESSIIQARQAIDDVLDGLTELKSRLGPQTSASEEGGSPE
jgi:hypothetical protein